MGRFPYKSRGQQPWQSRSLMSARFSLGHGFKAEVKCFLYRPCELLLKLLIGGRFHGDTFEATYFAETYFIHLASRWVTHKTHTFLLTLILQYMCVCVSWNKHRMCQTMNTMWLCLCVHVSMHIHTYTVWTQLFCILVWIHVIKSQNDIWNFALRKTRCTRNVIQWNYWILMCNRKTPLLYQISFLNKYSFIQRDSEWKINTLKRCHDYKAD